ncbi:hypothetical protein Q9Q95_06550 [Sphingomonas sp. DG1-23]|uniref:hypothetical protein n=1 Tax=Sphingomonas sp. DG1-23 TaxID=3068316 RepID=UPI00273F9BFB|nr:hypothetical protein [Sphingomonas sp. DG1-23]MDP5278577.1 hypothetical protein [Sphingomonas sp. DG1-23]
MIEFEPPIPRLRLLRRAVKWALKNKDHIPSLSDLAPRMTVEQLTELARSWQKIGFGSLMEVSEEGKRSVLFSLNDEAVSKVKAIERESLLGRIRSVSWGERAWDLLKIGVGALLGVLATKYFGKP